MTEEHYNALPTGYQLHEYRLDRVLGVGGFGITYLAWDNNLNKEVAIKEYLPSEFAIRAGEFTVQAKSSADTEDYAWGLERFLQEAQTLARFRHNSIVQVYRFFEAHGTAYMVMDYEHGEAFSDVMKRHKGDFDEEYLRAMLLPLLDGLAEVHRSNVLHRDIKPGNIFIREDGTPVLLDFGAARDAVGRKSKSLTSIVTPGYAPLEQYYADGNQGPWTDIYAMGAILYQAISGATPPEAPARVRADPFEMAAAVGADRYSTEFLSAVDWSLSIDEDARPQSVDEWRGAFTGARMVEGATMVAGRNMAPARPESPARSDTPAAPEAKKGGAGKWAAAAAIAVLLLGGGYFAMDRMDMIAGMTGSGETGDKPGDAANEEIPKESKDSTVPSEDEAKRVADEEAKKREAERQRKAEEDARQATTEQKRRAEERRKAEEQRKADDAAKKTDADRKAREAEKAREKADADRKARETQEARQKADAERKAREAAKARQKAEADRKAKEVLKRSEEKRKAEERRKKQQEQLAARDFVFCPAMLPYLNTKLRTRDCSSVNNLMNDILEKSQSGTNGRWRSRDKSYSGVVVPTGTFTRPDGIHCRTFTQSVTVNGQTKKASGTACRDRNLPIWRIVL